MFFLEFARVIVMPDFDKSVILRDGKCLLLAYDQGFEHGPVDFNEVNVDPANTLNIALESQVYTGLVFQEGVARSYYPVGGVNQDKVPPLVVKLNGRTSFHKGEEPVSLQLCTVDKAISLGARAVGYTIYVGSEHEEEMMVEFSRIEDEAHEKGLVVIAWMYPRGKHVEGKESSKEIVSYAARLGMELGADFVKLPYTGDKESFSWVVRNAGKTGVLIQGGTKKSEEELLTEIKGAMEAGAVGVAIGRNIWQSSDPIGLSKKVADVVYREIA
jgi:fructose-bisphosphate aldolase, class I